ncbi:hypothetical protein [Afipia sp. GAS231]|uniref:hypothetical protein n=1 Tax=Afipia sp. GAS231 TaxID=1882747 RepID=UPI000B8757AA|nr:hypothetical protein [Afipia sp. GAS231]
MFDIALSKRGRGWEWRVIGSSGKTVMQGGASKRAKARYQAERALFLLLMAAPAREIGREEKP